MTKKIKNYIKKLIYKLLKLISFKRIRAMANRELLVINYHSVLGSDPDTVINKNTYRSEEELIKDIVFLKKNYHFVDLSELKEHKLNGKKLPPNSIFLTVDDGLAVVYHIIRPILLEHKISAAFFVNPLFINNEDLHYQRKKNLIAQSVSSIEIETKHSMWKAIFDAQNIHSDNFHKALQAVSYKKSNVLNELANLFNIDVKGYLQDNKIYLSSAQLEKMVAEGFWFGGHSMDHPKYDELTLSEQIKQTLDSTRWVKHILGLPYSIFAFPLRDHHVSVQLFETISPDIELTFGVRGMGNDIITSHVQRIDVESTGVSIELALKLEYLKYVLQSFLRPKKYARPRKCKSQL